MEKWPKEVQESYTFSPEKAKKLLAEAGYPDGFSVECVVGSVPLYISILSLVKDWWKDINVELEIIPIDRAQETGMKWGKTYKHMLAVEANAPTPVDGLLTDAIPGSVDNLSLFLSDTFDDLFARFQKELDVDKQNALLKEINLHLVSQLASLYLPAPSTLVYAWPWVKNYEGESNTKYRSSTELFTIAWIDQNVKKDMGK
jgi:peptide/nickel transport system substrate-binding protein